MNSCIGITVVVKEKPFRSLQVQYEDDLMNSSITTEPAEKKPKRDIPYPVDLELEYVLASMPRKVVCLCILDRLQNKLHYKTYIFTIISLQLLGFSVDEAKT